MSAFDPKRSWGWVALAVLACACRREPEAAPANVVQPAPVAPAPAAATAPSEPVPQQVPAPAPPATGAAKPAAEAPRADETESAVTKRAVAKPSTAKSNAASKADADEPRARAKPSAPAPVRAAEPQPTIPSEPPPPEPAAPEPVAKPATRVVIPNTERVRVEVPAGLQGWLDKDTRMQPWLGKVMKVIDACYADVLSSNPNASGTIVFRITMHQNARPDPDIQSLPGQLSGVVACATGQLMRTRMPLFTGTEGEQYTVRVRFGT